MRNRITLALCLALLFINSPLVAQEAAKQESPKQSLDAKALIGVWNYSSGIKAGQKSMPEMMQGEVTVTEKTFTIPGGDGETFVMAYKIDSSKSPAEIDLRIESGPVPDGTALGIIKMDKGQIVFCYHLTDRPAEFKSTAENGCHLFTLKKSAAEMKLAGEWTYVSGKRAGEAIPPERMGTGISISDKEITIPAGPDQTFVMSYKVNTSANPVTIDMEMTDGPAVGAIAVGIVKVEGGELVLCYDPTGQHRPTEFKSTADNGCFLFSMKQAK